LRANLDVFTQKCLSDYLLSFKAMAFLTMVQRWMLPQEAKFSSRHLPAPPEHATPAGS
jgi:hypothetical protein